MNNDYNNQQYYQPPIMPPPGKDTATGSLVCGIISLVAMWLGYGAIIGLIMGIIAICLGVSAKKQGYVGGMATGGLVTGVIGTIISGVVFASCIACGIAVLGAAGAYLA